MKKLRILIFLAIALFSCKKTINEAKPELSRNNRLISINFSSSVKNINFSPTVYSYSTYILHQDVKEISLFAFPEDENATVEISPSGMVSIEIGESVSFTIKCRAANGNEKKTTVEVRRLRKANKELSNNAFLKFVKFSKGDLTPKFDKTKETGYVLLLDSSISNTKIFCLPEDQNANVEVKETPEGTLQEGGEKIYTVTVTAEDGVTKKNYVFTCRRESSAETADLIDIVVGNHETLTPSFKSSVLSYNVEVPNNVDKVMVKGILLNKNANVVVSPDGETSLIVGSPTIFTLTVSIPSSSIPAKTYTVKVTRDVVRNDNTFLASLTLKNEIGDVIPIVPNFVKTTKLYEARIAKNFDGFLVLEGTPEASTSKTQVFSSPSILGKNAGDVITLSCVVTSEAGNKETYVVKATRSESAVLSEDASLKELSLKDANGKVISISPAFTSANLGYTASVPFGFNSKAIPVFVKNHKNAIATYKVTPKTLENTSGATQVFTITVVAENGIANQNYTITLNRDAADEDTNLKYLLLKRDYLSEDVEFTPSFNANITDYEATVPFTTKFVRFVFERNSSNSITDPVYPMEWKAFKPEGADKSMTLSLKVIAQSGAEKIYKMKIKASSFDDQYLKMVDVITTKTEVVGKDSEGVFIEGRTVEVEPYKMSECEITYASYAYVKTWAKDNGFSFKDESSVKKGSQDEEENEPACGVKSGQKLFFGAMLIVLCKGKSLFIPQRMEWR
ncbi:MAG: cadherin-like beta sandwich domain-containing protein [Treponema sp.]